MYFVVPLELRPIKPLNSDKETVQKIYCNNLKKILSYIEFNVTSCQTIFKNNLAATIAFLAKYTVFSLVVLIFWRAIKISFNYVYFRDETYLGI